MNETQLKTCKMWMCEEFCVSGSVFVEIKEIMYRELMKVCVNKCENICVWMKEGRLDGCIVWNLNLYTWGVENLI
jgi:hypothetical protein